MENHEIEFESGMIIKLDSDREPLAGMSPPPGYYHCPVWMDALPWIDLIKQIPNFKREILQNYIYPTHPYPDPQK